MIQVSVIPLGRALEDLKGDVCVVIDVIRATTALVSIFESGAERVFITGAAPDPVALRDRLGSDCLLCAEMAEGDAPPGFDAQPSPVAISDLDLRGRIAALATANGTPAALEAIRAGASDVLFGSLRNLRVAIGAAYTAATERNAGITIICAGRLRNSRIALEDFYCAGRMVTLLEELAGHNPSVVLDDSAVIAREVAARFRDAEVPLRTSLTGQRFIEAGLEADVSYCARTDAVAFVPQVVNGVNGDDWIVEVVCVESP